jgi:DNA-binding transcriptional LysR family regulator
MRRLDIPTLEIFIAAVEEKSLSKAADRENLVTSAISKRITELERQTGKALLIRHGRGVEPTPAGNLLYQRAKAILRSVQLTEDAITGFAADGMAKIRLAANPSTILQFLPGHIASYLARSPDTRIDLLEGHSYDIPRIVADDDADIGIYHAAHPAPGVDSHPYMTDRVGLVVPRNHPLAAKQSLFLEEALDYDLLGYFPRHSLEAFLSLTYQSLSRPPNVKAQVSNFEARCHMIHAGLGIGIVPERIARSYLADLQLELLRLEDAWAVRQFYICVPGGGNLKEAVAGLLSHLLNIDQPDPGISARQHIVASTRSS